MLLCLIKRYAILSKETWPSWHGDPREGIERIMRTSHMDNNQYQLGRTKVFIKAPESVKKIVTVVFLKKV